MSPARPAHRSAAALLSTGQAAPRVFHAVLSRSPPTLRFLRDAVIGLVGVLVGALIAGAWGWFSEVRRELAEAVVAARLVTNELNSWDLARARSQDAWLVHRADLARVLGADEWASVSEAYTPVASDRQVTKAIDALKPLARGKRHQVIRRLRNIT